jgi:hypothetical protein
MIAVDTEVAMMTVVVAAVVVVGAYFSSGIMVPVIFSNFLVRLGRLRGRI